MEMHLKELQMISFLTAKQIQNIYNLHARTLANWRIKNIGPPLYRAGRKILYKAIEVEKWLKKRHIKTADK
jgi:hypothetical protein